MSATVAAVSEQACPPAEAGTEQPDGWRRRCGEARVTITEGSAKGQTVTMALPQGAASPLRVGEDIARWMRCPTRHRASPCTPTSTIRRGEPLFARFASRDVVAGGVAALDSLPSEVS